MVGVPIPAWGRDGSTVGVGVVVDVDVPPVPGVEVGVAVDVAVGVAVASVVAVAVGVGVTVAPGQTQSVSSVQSVFLHTPLEQIKSPSQSSSSVQSSLQEAFVWSVMLKIKDSHDPP